MKRTLRLTLTCALAAVMCACTATAENLTGEAEGYGGPLKVAVTVEEGKITQVRVTEHKETEGVGTKAIDTLPDAIVQANSTQVDVVAGPTATKPKCPSVMTKDASNCRDTCRSATAPPSAWAFR